RRRRRRAVSCRDDLRAGSRERMHRSLPKGRGCPTTQNRSTSAEPGPLAALSLDRAAPGVAAAPPRREPAIPSLRRGRGAQRSPGKGRHHGLPARAHGRRGSRGGETGGLRRPAAAGPLPSLRRHSWRTAVCRHWALRPGAQGTAPGLPAEPDERTSAPLEQNLALKRACRSARRAWHLQPTRKDMDVIRIQAGLHEAPKETPRDTVDSRSVGARKSRRPRRPFNRTERGPDCATLNSVGSSGVAVSLGGSASQECNLERLRQRRRRSNAA
ncbi:unnamed protein product, partial [Prorocentrum cordatum]